MTGRMELAGWGGGVLRLFQLTLEWARLRGG